MTCGNGSTPDGPVGSAGATSTGYRWEVATRVAGDMDDPTDKEIDVALEELVERGDAEFVGMGSDGERRYRLTPQGVAKAEDILKGD